MGRVYTKNYKIIEIIKIIMESTPCGRRKAGRLNLRWMDGWMDGWGVTGYDISENQKLKVICQE